MSLFIGNLSRHVRYEDLRDEFERMGPCSIKQKEFFAFVDYDNEGDAQKAITNLMNKDMEGRKLNIEWSKKSRNFSDSRGGRDGDRRDGDRRGGDRRDVDRRDGDRRGRDRDRRGGRDRDRRGRGDVWRFIGH